MNHYPTLIALLFLLLLPSCATKGQTGAAGGDTASQTIGHNTAATLSGAAAGSLSLIVGNAMDKYDREQLNHTLERGISNYRSAWVNPDTGNQYAVMPQPAYQDPDTHQSCRRAEIEVFADGQPQRASSTACRDSYGSWQLR